MNIAEILKKCPKGMKLYSPVYGEVKLEDVRNGQNFSIHCITENEALDYFTSDGRLYCDFPDAECVLFPSKDQRDWSKFIVPDKVNDQKPKTELKPFDKVLVRNADTREWIPDFFIKERRNSVFRFGCIVTGAWKQCIPYEGNEHLLGTTNNPEE